MKGLITLTAAAAAALFIPGCTPVKEKGTPTASTAATAIPASEVTTLAPLAAAQDIRWTEWAPYGSADARLDWPSGAAFSEGKLYLVGTRRAKVADAATGANSADVVFVEVSPAGVADRATFRSHYGERAGAGVATAADGRIWLVGGFYTPPPLKGVPEGQLDYAPLGTPVADVNSWKPGDADLAFEAALPVPRGDAATVFDGPQLYVVAGLSNKSNVKDENNQQIHDFDPRDRLWRKYHDFKFPTAAPAACVAKKGLFILGGRRQQPAYVTNVCFRYDLLVFKWQRVPPIPAPRAGAKAFAVGSFIYLLGGYERQELGQPGALARAAFRYDLKKQVWERLGTPLPEGSLFVAYDGNAFYLIGEHKTYRGAVVAGAPGK